MTDPKLVLSREQVRRVDQLAVERYAIPSLLLMENAGRNAADLIRAHYASAGAAAIFCGPGNNGGDGLVIARHLHNAGWTVRIFLAGDSTRLTPDTATNFDIAGRMHLPITVFQDLDSARRTPQSIRPDDVVVDALLGTGFHGEVRSPLGELIDGLNNSPRRAMVAVDVPSGLDCDTGVAARSTIRAALTITFVAFKRGFLAPGAAAFTGRIEVAEIGAPRELVEEVIRPSSVAT